MGLIGNCADVIPEFAASGIVPDMVTDQTSAHDPLDGYVPSGISFAEALHLRERDPDEYMRHVKRSMAAHVEGMLALQRAGCGGVRLRQQYPELCRKRRRDAMRFRFLGLCPSISGRCFARGAGHFAGLRFPAIRKIFSGQIVWLLSFFPENRELLRWI